MTKRILRWGAVAVVLSVAAGVAGDQGATSQRDGLERFEGTWRYRGSPDEGRAIITRAIERATDDMFFATRGIIRDRLEDKNRFSREVDIAFPPGGIRVGFDMITYVTPVDGRPVRVPTPDRESADLSQRYEDGRLVQVFSTEEGRRTNVFTLADGGDALRYDVRVDSGKIPERVRYRLVYDRVR